MKTFITHSEIETMELGERVGGLLIPGAIVLLSGELGSGKTILTKGIAKGLDIKDMITSPTYTILHQYEGRLPLYHFDIYRLEDPDDMFDLDYEDFFYGDGVTVVEWPERMEGYYPKEYMMITMEKYNEQARKIIITTVGKQYQRLEGDIEDK